jgi:hypothetical protein
VGKHFLFPKPLNGERRKIVETQTAMAFYHQDGLAPAWLQGIKYAGKDGKIATMPDIVEARLATNSDDYPWEAYFTTLTAEYFGYSKQGNLILIVAHGIGPMSSLAGIQKAYSWEFKDKDRRNRGGRITQQDFWDLEAGKYGEVGIVDFEAYCRLYEYPFLKVLKLSEALLDPLLKARFGLKTEEYLLVHAGLSRNWHRKMAGFKEDDKQYQFAETILGRMRGENLFCKKNTLPVKEYLQHLLDGAVDSDPYIITLEGASNCCYTFGKKYGHRKIEEGYAIAHLISTGSLCCLHHEGEASLVLDVSCHEWWNGVRLVAIKPEGDFRSGIQQGPDTNALLKSHWKELLIPISNVEEVGFRAMVSIGNQWFTQYPKIGERMDTWEPEYLIKSFEKINKPVLFRTTAGGGFFFKFGINEIRAIAPPTANAYSFVSDPEKEYNNGNCTHITAWVQFYRITVDTTKRLMRAEALARNYEKMMELLSSEG